MSCWTTSSSCAPGTRCRPTAIITSAGLELNEANLTGESDPVAKEVGEEIMSGTIVVAGAGATSASQVGADAYVNRIAADARKFTRTRSEIQDSINTLLTYITWVIVGALPLRSGRSGARSATRAGRRS